MTLDVVLWLTFQLFLQTNLPVFKVKDSSVRRRYSDFEWLRNELERDSKVIKGNQDYEFNDWNVAWLVI